MRVDFRAWRVHATCTGTVNGTRTGTDSTVLDPNRTGRCLALFLRRGDSLRESDEMTSGILDTEFLHAVEGGAHGHDDFHVFHGREHGVEIVHLHIKICGTFSGLRNHGRLRVFLDARTGLV